ncbi:hypothetical protein L218DRAFT_884094, partial [Marasmius fiardii PR-910]
GNLPELLLTQPYGKSEFKWNEQFGSTYRIKGCFSVCGVVFFLPIRSVCSD